MNVADHALARRNRARENMFDRMAGLVFGNSGIGRSAETGMSERRVRAGMCGVAIIGINHMTSRAAAAAIVARMIIGARKRHDRVEQTCLLQAEENRIGAKLRAEAAFTQLVVWLA